MLLFAVSAEKNRQLQQKMAELGVSEEDLEESFVRSSGKGGQHINKTSTSVQLRQKPTVICVTASRERSQSINRFLARRELMEHLEQAQGGTPPEMQRIARLRKQKQRRKRRSRPPAVDSHHEQTAEPTEKER